MFFKSVKKFKRPELFIKKHSCRKTPVIDLNNRLSRAFMNTNSLQVTWLQLNADMIKTISCDWAEKNQTRDISDFQCRVIVGCPFKRCKKNKTSSQRHLSENVFFNLRGQMRLTRLLKVIRKGTYEAQYNSDVQKDFSEHGSRLPLQRSSRQMWVLYGTSEVQLI